MMIPVRFPGGAAVEAVVGRHVVRTDQPIEHGGGATAPSPFDLFLASVATCAGHYAQRFCQERGLSSDGLALTLAVRRDVAGKQVTGMRLDLTLPAGFPAKYRDAIQRAIELCAVKRQVQHPPEFFTVVHDPVPQEEHVRELVSI